MYKVLITIAVVTFVARSVWSFEIDFSRRKPYMKNHEVQSVLPEKAPEPLALETVRTNFEVSQDIVILNTEKGFVPKSLSLKEGVKYRIHVVNVNEKEKNVSFIMSAFAEHHGTYYGQIKTFEVIPQKEGVYTYQCPETSLEGRVVVLPRDDQGQMRSIASEKQD
jgi:plastocyanin